MFSESGVFLVNTFFQFYIMILILRVFLQYFRTNYFNPVSQFVVKLTDPVVKPIQSYIPGFKGVDLSVVALVFVFELIKVVLIFLMTFGALPGIVSLIKVSVVQGFSQLTTLLFYLLIGRIILSWIQSPSAGPIQEVCYTVTEPLMGPVRRVIPPVSGFDLSPLVVIVLLQLTNIIVLRLFNV